MKPYASTSSRTSRRGIFIHWLKDETSEWANVYNNLICQIQVECSRQQEGSVEADDGGREAEEADGVKPEQDSP